MNETSGTVVTEQVDDFWRTHVITAQDFLGTDSEYCRRNEINHKTFHAYKKKYGYTKPMKARRVEKFVNMKLKPEPMQTTKPVTQAIASEKVLPDAKWVAEFVSALLANQ